LHIDDNVLLAAKNLARQRSQTAGQIISEPPQEDNGRAQRRAPVPLRPGVFMVTLDLVNFGDEAP
jgi:hypothetical protein